MREREQFRDRTDATQPTNFDQRRNLHIEGARLLKQSSRIGSLAAGKQADLVMIRATDLNMQPVINAVNSVVMQTSLANINSVMVAGEWKKRHGQLLGVNLAPYLEALRASSRKITAAMTL